MPDLAAASIVQIGSYRRDAGWQGRCGRQLAIQLVDHALPSHLVATTAPGSTARSVADRNPGHVGCRRPEGWLTRAGAPVVTVRCDNTTHTVDAASRQHRRPGECSVKQCRS